MEKVAKKDLPGFARKVLERITSLASTQDERSTIVALSGELGAGKTTFVQALGKALSITETMQSPTYVLMKSYEIPQGGTLTPILSKASPFRTLIHIDAYRLNSPEEFKTLKPETFLHDPKNLILVEWPERLGDALPVPDLTLRFSSEGASENERYIEVV